MRGEREKVRVVIIGMGRMGRTRYEAMARHGGFEVAGVCDVNLDNLKDYDCPGYTNWQKCFEEAKPQAVFVCTINKEIPKVVCAALERGMAVFSEKPPGRTLADAVRMRETQSRTGGILKFGFNHRYHNSIIEAKALIDSRILGDVVCIRGVYGKAGSPHFPEEWRNDPAKSGGGILLDQGIHMLDLMCYLTDSDMQVLNSNVDNLVWKQMQTEDSAMATLCTEKGQLVFLHSSAIQWKHKFDMDIICTKGYIALNGFLTSTRSYGTESITYYRKDLETMTGRLGKPKEYTMCFDEDSSWDLEIGEFYKNCINGEPICNGTANESVRVMRIIEAIYEKGRGMGANKNFR